MSLPVTEIQRFCMHDGDGIRTVVFLKGCPLKCAWCHNPEARKAEQEILYYSSKCIDCGACVSACPRGAQQLLAEGREFFRESCIACESCVEICPTGALAPAMKLKSIEDIISIVERDSAFFASGGGVTLSGGEPLIHGEGAIELLKQCKKKGISTAVETCGYIPKEILEQAVDYVDLFLWDVKDTDDNRHKEYTGVSNKKIIENLLLADSLGATTAMRCIIVNRVNSDNAHVEALAKLWHKLSHCRYIEIIPYHAYGGSKMLPLGKEDNGIKEWIPARETIEEIKSGLRSLGVVVKK